MEKIKKAASLIGRLVEVGWTVCECSRRLFELNPAVRLLMYLTSYVTGNVSHQEVDVASSLNATLAVRINSHSVLSTSCWLKLLYLLALHLCCTFVCIRGVSRRGSQGVAVPQGTVFRTLARRLFRDKFKLNLKNLPAYRSLYNGAPFCTENLVCLLPRI